MAATFDSVDDRLNCADESAFDWERTSPFSLAAWIKLPVTVDTTAFILKGEAATQRGFAFNTKVPATPTIQLHITNNGIDHLEQFGPNSAILPFLWVHALATYDGSSTRAGVDLYRNGMILTPNPVGADALTATILNDQPFTVGGDGGGTEWWGGSVAGVVADNVEWTAAEALNLAKLNNFNRHPSGFLSVAPELWLPISAQARSTAFDLNDYANNHDATIVGAPTTEADPAVVIDWRADHAVLTDQPFTTTTSFTHAPDVSALQGVLVFIAQNVASADLISSVTYGGVAMKRVGFAQDTAGEPGASYIYFLGSGVPSGSQTVTVTVASGTDAKHAWVLGLLGVGDLQVVASGIVQGDTANPSVTLATPLEFVGLAASVVFSGHNAVGSITPGTGYQGSSIGGSVRDFGTQVARVELANMEGANVVCNWTAASEDCAMVALAIGVQDIPRNPAINHQEPAFL